MFSAQNLSPKQLSAFTAIVLSVTGGASDVLSLLPTGNTDWVPCCLFLSEAMPSSSLPWKNLSTGRSNSSINSFIKPRPREKKKSILNISFRKKALMKYGKMWKDGATGKRKKLNCFERTRPSGKSSCKIFPTNSKHPFSPSRDMWIPC